MSLFGANQRRRLHQRGMVRESGRATGLAQMDSLVATRLRYNPNVEVGCGKSWQLRNCRVRDIAYDFANQFPGLAVVVFRNFELFSSFVSRETSGFRDVLLISVREKIT